MLASILNRLVAPSVVIFTGPGAEIVAVVVTVEPVEVTVTPPKVELSAAVELVIAPEPDKAIFPDAVIPPVGATVVPPLTVKVPAELIVPEPV
jgi:hypothetical protein